MKGLGVAKNAKAVKFEGVWDELESKKKVSRNNNSEMFATNSCAQNRKGLISVFQEFSASINKTFILAGRLGASLSFYEMYILS